MKRRTFTKPAASAPRPSPPSDAPRGKLSLRYGGEKGPAADVPAGATE